MSGNPVQNVLIHLKSPRWRWAFLTAVLSDALGFGVALWPPAEWLLDALTAAVLLAILGFRWPLMAALAVEVVPGLQLCPAWTLVVVALAGSSPPESATALPRSGGPPEHPPV